MQHEATVTVPRLEHITIVHVSPDDETFRPRLQRHALHELVYIVRGRYEVHTLGAAFEGRRGDVFCFAPGQTHRPAYVPQGQAGRCEAIVAQWAEPDAETAYPVRQSDEAGRLFAALSWLHDLRREDDRDAADALLRLILRELHRSGEQRPFLVQSIHVYVLDHLGETIRIDDLAAVAGLSRYHFIRAFKEQTGMTPMAYVMQVRVDEARRMIKSSTTPLREIAEATGFSSAFHLSRRFSERFGLSPSEARRETSPSG